jgi:hypothetical protein
VWLEYEAVQSVLPAYLIGRNAEVDPALARDAIKPLVCDTCSLPVRRLAKDGSTLLPLNAAHFEDVGEVASVFCYELNWDGFPAEAAHIEPCDQNAYAKLVAPEDVNGITFENELVVDVDIRIGEVGPKAVAIFTNARTKKQRPCTIQPEDQAR